MGKLLSDIEFSRSALVAGFLELEVAARSGTSFHLYVSWCLFNMHAFIICLLLCLIQDEIFFVFGALL